MSRVAVIHMDLMSKGGGEAVAMNVLEALQRRHDVTLITLTDPDLPHLNAYFNIGVDESSLTVERAGRLAPWMNERYGLKYYILQNALLGRYAKRHADEYDLLVSTINELGLETDSVQYIHFPFDWTVSLENRDEIFHPTVEEESLYERLCTRVADINREELVSNTLLANSDWTADVVEDAYGTRPEVVYPPVDTTDFTDRPWSERENGFVTVGRIERSKRIAEIIRVMDGLRERGHDVHLHVIGPTVDETYRREIGELADERQYVYLEGEVPRKELVERICSHRFGIHGKEFEHFGMAVAELVAGGAVTFVPNDGGQHAIVDDRQEQQYSSVDDAVEKVCRTLEDDDLRRRLRTSTAEVERRFGRARFQREIVDAVDAALDRSTERSPDTAAPTVEHSPGSQARTGSD